MKGRASPNEYTANSKIPVNAPPWDAASSRADPKKTPTQGVQPIEKTIPNKSEEKNPGFLYPNSSFLVLFKRGMFKTPVKCKPKNITMDPVTIFTTVLFCEMNVPIDPAKAPNVTNTIVKPKVKPIAFITVFVKILLNKDFSTP